jgi:hypothetical protein
MGEPVTDEPKYCEAKTYAATLETPAEWCEDEAVPFSDYCGFHLYLDSDAMFDDDNDRGR